MKNNRIINIMAATLVMLSATACKAQKETSAATSTAVQTISLPAFDAIRNESAADVYFMQGSRQSVKVKQADNWRLKLSVSGKTLILETEERYLRTNNKNCVEVWITAPSLKSISNNGALHVTIGDMKDKELNIDNDGALTVKADRLDLRTLTYKNNGALTDTLNIHSKDIHIDNNGSLHTQLDVNCDNFNINNSGAFQGDMNLKGKIMKIENQGSLRGGMDVDATTMILKNYGIGEQKIDFTGVDMNIVNNGSMNVDLHVDCKKLNAESSGISKLTISGTADDAQLDSDGMSKIESSKLNKF